jgi:type IX secretion system PorP/SprF family membrane protein
MKKLMRLFFIAGLLSCALGTSAQQRPIQSLYMFDPLLINPAYAGDHVQLSATAIYRNQWVNFPGAPRTFTGTVHSGFRKVRFGLGLIFGNDQIGVHSDNSLYFAYSYRLPLNRNTGASLSMGLQGGFNNLKSDYGKLNPKDQDIYGSLTKFNPNFGAGLYYRDQKMYIGISIPYILNNKFIDMSNTNGIARQYRYYYVTAGTSKKISNNIKFQPSVLLRIQEKAPLSFDLNGMWVLYNVVGVGVSYRLRDAVVGLFELQLNNNFHVGYAYDFTTSAIRQYSNGSHEIMINYRIKISKLHRGLECPSYFGYRD